MSQLLVELCVILIEEKFGERIASLWQHVADIGRTTFKDLLASSNVNRDDLAKILAILLQQRCLNYFTDEEYDSAYYSVNVEGAYNIIRLSRLVDVARKRCGADAAKVMSSIAQFGQISVKDLTRLYEIHEPTKIDRLHGILLSLLHSGFLIRARPHFSQNSYDLEQELEKNVMEQEFAGKRVTGPVSSRNFQEAVNSRKRRQHEMDYANDDFPVSHRDGGIHANKKRKLNRANGHNGALAPHNTAASPLKDDFILYVNTKKYLIALRSERLEHRAFTALGPTGASVYGSLLRTLERQISDLKQSIGTTVNYDSDEDDDGVTAAPTTSSVQPRTTAMQIESELPPNLDFTTSMKVSSKDLPKKSTNGHKASARVIVDEDNFDDIGIKEERLSDDDEDRGEDFPDLAERAKLYELLNSHLDLLAEHPLKFCTKPANKNPPEWQVDFPNLTQKLLLAEIDTTISARFGTAATRLVRLLREKGKLEEKQISTLAYMPMKDVRTLLTELFANGFVDAQELAKDNQRQPSKALYLWYVDINKVRSAMLQRCYHAMCRTYQRMAFERQKYANVIQKVHDTIEERLGDRRAPYIPTDDDDDSRPFISGEAGHDHLHTNGFFERSGLDDGPSSETLVGDENGLHAQTQRVTNGIPSALDVESDLQHDDHEPSTRSNHKSIMEPNYRAGSKFVVGTSGLMKDFSTNTLEKQHYREWRQQEALFLGHILKLDDLVVVLRDF